MTGGNLWTIVLAAGEGSRLRGMTLGPDGASVPKQYWTIDGNTTMLQWTLRRAARLTSRFRIVPVVAAGHQRHWDGALGGLPSWNVLIQPDNRGTAAGILFPLLSVLQRDPEATVIIMPSDHYVEDETGLENTLRDVVRGLADHPDRVVLVGITPESADPELGYLLPAESDPGSDIRPLRAFVEKPAPARARELIEQGAAWNSFIMVARGQALLNLYESAQPALLNAFTAVMGHRGASGTSLMNLYLDLPAHDFSRDVLQKTPSSLSMVVAPACGWTDLGTPERVRAWRAGLREEMRRPAMSRMASTGAAMI